MFDYTIREDGQVNGEENKPNVVKKAAKKYNDQVYIGEWNKKTGKPHGQGILIGTSILEGFFKDGLKNG